MAEENQPTEAEVSAANAAEMAKWEDDFKPEDLQIKSGNEVEEKVEKKLEEDDKELVEEISYDEPEPVVTVPNPGEYIPKDYSFDVTLDGKTVKIETVQQAEQYADEHAEEFTAKDLLAFMRKANKMETGLEIDRDKYELAKEKYDEQVAIDGERQQTIANLASEIEYLIAKGMLPEPDAEYKAGDWTDPMVAKQPGVREQIELVNYMKKENDARIKSGVKPMTSMIDAYNAMRIDKSSKENDDVSKRSAEARKAVGGQVAAATVTHDSKYPKGISVGDPNVFKNNRSIWE